MSCVVLVPLMAMPLAQDDFGSQKQRKHVLCTHLALMVICYCGDST